MSREFDGPQSGEAKNIESNEQMPSMAPPMQLFAGDDESPPKTATIRGADNVALHSGPRRFDKVEHDNTVGDILSGDQVTILDDSKAWVKVEWKGKIGYVSQEYVHLNASSDTKNQKVEQEPEKEPEKEIDPLLAKVLEKLGDSPSFRSSSGGMHYVFMALDKIEPYLITRGDDDHFTESATETNTSGNTEYMVNTNMADYSYASAMWGPMDKEDLTTEGRVVENDRIVDGSSHSSTFYTSYDDGEFAFGQGNPPVNSDLAFGGAYYPFIINGLPYGAQNEYSKGVPSGAPQTGEPGSKHKDYMTQRSSRAMGNLSEEGTDTGIPVFGVSKQHGFALLMVRNHNEGDEGALTIEEMRDLLIRLGVENAIGFDGSTSTTLVADSTVLEDPASVKDNTMPYGMGFRLPH